MTIDQKTNKKSDTGLPNEMTSHCCGVDYIVHLTKSGMFYYSLEDLALSKPITYCSECGQTPPITIDHSDNILIDHKVHQSLESIAKKNELKEWQLFKSNNPLDGTNKIFNFITEIFLLIMLLFCCYQGYEFIKEMMH